MGQNDIILADRQVKVKIEHEYSDFITTETGVQQSKMLPNAVQHINVKE